MIDYLIKYLNDIWIADLSPELLSFCDNIRDIVNVMIAK